MRRSIKILCATPRCAHSRALAWPLITATRRLPASATRCRLAEELTSGRRWRRWHQAPLAAGSPASPGVSSKPGISSRQKNRFARTMSFRKSGFAMGISSAGTRPRKAATGSSVMPARKCSFLQRFLCDLRSPLRAEANQGFKVWSLGAGTWSSEGEGEGAHGCTAASACSDCGQCRNHNKRNSKRQVKERTGAHMCSPELGKGSHGCGCACA